MAVTSRFVLFMQLAPRTLETAAQMMATVAACCNGTMPLLLADNHRPYPAAILQVFGLVQHRRRRHGHGRFKHKRLKPPPGLKVGIVVKVRDAASNLVKVKQKALFGRLKEIRQTIRKLNLGQRINTAHIERHNGTTRGHVGRLARRTRDVTRKAPMLQNALSIWRDVFNWVIPNWALQGRTPAMEEGLAKELWTMVRYVNYPVHVARWQREIWAEEEQIRLTSALDARNRRKMLPTS